MSDDRKQPGVAFWSTIVVVTVVLYILSSGPARTLLMRKSRGTVTIGGLTIALGHVRFLNQEKWEAVYSPLDWAANQWFGAPLEWYWELFPVYESP